MAKLQVILLIALLSLVFGISGRTDAAAQDLAGNWSGSWQSQSTGHRGRISATFCQVNSCQVQAKFRGTFARIIPFRYRTNLNIVHQEPGLTIMAGSRRLGPLMGTFSYEAVISNGQFSAQYSSKRDRGTWNLSRRPH